MSGEQTPERDLRARLARIPRLDEQPIESPWLEPTGEHRLLGEPEPVHLRPQFDREPIQPEEPLPRTPHVEEEFFEEPERRSRRRWPWFLLALMVILGVLVAIPAYSAWRTFNGIERVPVSEAFVASPSGRNILIVGTDSRAGIDAQTENAGNILGEGITGERSDTIMVLHIGDDGAQRTMSLPRDLWLPINQGAPQRINTAIAQGPAALVTTIQSELGIPITSYVEVDLAGFIDIVDAVGGVTITFEHPAFDRASGLNVPEAGDVTLDSTQALAYVRSRRYTEVVDGAERPDPTSDLGRVKRQQILLRALLDEVTAERNPLSANDLLRSVADSVRIDDRATFTEVAGLALDLRGGLPESVELPTRSASIGGASVLELASGADQVLADFVR